MDEKKVCKPGFNACEPPKECEHVTIEKTLETADKLCKPGFNDCEPPVKRFVKTADENMCKPGFNDCVKVDELVEEQVQRDELIKEITTANFQDEVIKSEIPVLLEFSAEWCGHCKNMKPVVNDMAVLYEGQLKVGIVDVDKEPKIAEAFNVVGIPVLAIVKDGKVVKSEPGEKTKKELNDYLADVVAKPEELDGPIEIKVQHEDAPADYPKVDAVCKPGFNDCATPEKHDNINRERNPGVCLPGYNDCNPSSGIRDLKPSDKAPEDRVCKPGFNDCD